MGSISEVWRKLRNKTYRDGYTEAQLSIEVPFQIRALRKARGWTQVQLAERCGIPQARISHIEQPGRDPLSLRTLYRLASAFDVGLLVQFVSFRELVRREASFHPETFRVAGFEDDHPEETVPTTWDPEKAFPVEIEATPWDFRFLFFESTEDETGNPIREKKARIVMSPQQAEAFSRAMAIAVERWKKETSGHLPNLPE